MIKKTLAIVLALLMVLAVFAGCGKKNTDIAGGTSADTTESVETTTDTEEETPGDETTTAGDDDDDGTTTTAGDDEEEEESTTLDDEFTGDEDLPVDDTSIFDDMTIEDLLKPENFIGSDIPEDVDFGGYTFNMLVDTTNYNKEFVAESDGDLIKDAVVSRQDYIEEYVGIDFAFTETTGGYNNMEGYANEIEIASGAGTPYDLALAYNLIPPVVAAKGLSKDLAESENLKLLETEKPYWGQTFRDEVQIQSRIFWMSDNSSWNNVRNMLCMYVNLEYFSRVNEGKTKADLYAMVDNKTWTIDNLIALIQNSYNDDTLDQAVDDGDSFGLQAAESGAWLDNWIYAAGFRHTEKNAEGLYEWTWGNQEFIDFVKWWQEKLGDKNIDKQDTTQYKMFKESRAMFALSTVGMTEQNLELEYTVLPLPLYNRNIKDGYSTPFSNTYSSYLIPKAAATEAFERSATVLELLAAEGNRRLAPVYFEIYLKRQSAAEDPDMQRMFNIIRNSIVFDLGYLYGSSLTVEKLDGSGAMAEVFINLRWIWSGASGYDSIETVWAAISSTATTKLSNLMIDIVDY